MAEGEAEGRSPLPRSVSFQRLERWLGWPDAAPPPSAGAQQQQHQTPTPEPVGRRSPGRAASFSVSRNVAKLATSSFPPELPPPPPPPSGSRALRSLSPSEEEAAAAPACGGGAAQEPPEEPSPSPSPRGCKGPSEPPKAGEAPSDWPRVTEMRKLFGESFRRQQQQQEEESGARPAAKDSGPDGQPERCKSPPPPPPPRSCIPFRTHRLPGRAPRAETARPPPPPQLWDSLHSWHSSPKPAPPSAAWTSSAASAPSTAAGCSSVPGESSGRQEAQVPSLDQRPPAASAGGNGWHPSPERSSGSEEDEDRLALPRERSSIEEPGFSEQGPGGDGLAGMEWHRKAQEDLSGDLALLAEPRTRPFFQTKRLAGDSTPLVASPGEARPAGGLEGHRPFVRGLSEGGGAPPAGPPPPLSSASPLPQVSRVAKVNIPPFVPSPCGSRSSSRYSSTETLKDFRSPSFSQSESLARLQAQVRTRPKVPSGIVRTKADLPGYDPLYRCGGETAEKPRHLKSMSNPDIASETLTLLTFLKSDLSELKARKMGGRLSDQEEATLSGTSRYESGHPAAAGHQPAGGAHSEVQPPTRWALGNRPTLKDLTATLRRAKSFTYSDKPPPRRLFYQSPMKQSSSELLLATGRDHEGAFSDGEIGRDVDDGMPVVIQDQYIQEARQVFEKISKIGSQNDYSFGLDQKDSGNLKEGGEDEKLLGRPEGSREHSLDKADSEGDNSCRKSLEELSGRESSMMDEGIVTELETCPAYRYLDASVAAWRLANQRENEAGLAELKGLHLPSHVSKANQEKAAFVDEALPKTVPQGLSEAPSTPGALRRRRKFPSVGNSGSESSNGSSGESNGETYRSLSDPMPHRRRSITEDSNNFSVDSNFLGSLNSKPGIPESSAVALSECTGSAASDLSVCSDGVKDYSTVIQNIVSLPGAMDRVIDEKGNGKTIKKKSFSDPSRRSELASSAFEGPGEAISEMDQVIPPSSSEPILSERDQMMGKDQDARKLYSQSEHVLTAPPEGDTMEAAQNYGFDPKLAEVLSPRIVRRSSKKRTNRVNGHENRQDEAAPSTAFPATLGTTRPASKHVRHTSEPATFIPISDVNPPASLNLNAHAAMPESSRLPAKPYPVLQAPSLEDVTKHYMLTLHSGEPSPANTVDMPRSSPATPTTSEPRLPRCSKHHEEPSARSKPQV
ncbi:PREDICTED: rho guanine nucleotide exchange factor 17-like, partial [Gekko japonicus]|uniref:Rho guanine nucleotide exchange factor 17-like n=1 Tax=Gekko japonicus TaxID=146911 RepID=A0ABM1LCU0_GEKJA